MYEFLTNCGKREGCQNKGKRKRTGEKGEIIKREGEDTEEEDIEEGRSLSRVECKVRVLTLYLLERDKDGKKGH